MSAKSDALEHAVTELIAARAALDVAPGARARARGDRAFARLAALLAPRVRYFTRAYGLSDVAEDAQQVCAIAIHRAAGQYDPTRARFTTYVNWQLRAELQALRLRLYGDRRCAARRQVTATLSLDAMVGQGADAWLADPVALEAAEQRAADCLAGQVADRLVADWSDRRGARIDARRIAEQALVRHQLIVTDAAERLRESDRHIVRRALADIARHAGIKRH